MLDQTIRNLRNPAYGNSTGSNRIEKDWVDVPAYGNSTGSNRIEKDWVGVPAGNSTGSNRIEKDWVGVPAGNSTGSNRIEKDWVGVLLDLFEERGERVGWFIVCEAPLGDWANGGFGEYREYGFSSMGN